MNTKRLLGLFVLLSGMLVFCSLTFAEPAVIPEDVPEDINGEPTSPPEEVVPPDTVNPEPAPPVDTTPAEAATGDDGGGCQVGNPHNDALPMIVLLLALGYLAWRPSRPNMRHTERT